MLHRTGGDSGTSYRNLKALNDRRLQTSRPPPQKSSGRVCQLGDWSLQQLEHLVPGTKGHWGTGSMGASPPGEGSQSKDWDFTS